MRCAFSTSTVVYVRPSLDVCMNCASSFLHAINGLIALLKQVPTELLQTILRQQYTEQTSLLQYTHTLNGVANRHFLRHIHSFNNRSKVCVLPCEE